MAASHLNRIPVIYSPHLVAQAISYSPSSYKPKLVAEALAASTLPVRFVEPCPVSVEDLSRVHSPAFVKGILSCDLFNGFGDQEPEVAKSLPYTCGAMLDAARMATAELPAAALCSGFHHAGYGSCHGFCTFNGLMVAAAALLAEGHVSHVAIVDADMHVGDGTDDILGLIDGLEERIQHISLGREHRARHHAQAYLETMRGLGQAFRESRPDLILYQAGADPHVNDPLGGVLTSEELRERDRILFQIAHDQGIPMAWNLAGGYQRTEAGGIDPVVAIHLATFEEAVQVYLTA
mgnify:CR=1 FL=1